MKPGSAASFKWYAGWLIVFFMLFSTPTPFIHSNTNESSHVTVRGMEFHTETVTRAPSAGMVKHCLPQLALLVLFTVAALAAPRPLVLTPPSDDGARLHFQLLRRRMLIPHQFSSDFLS